MISDREIEEIKNKLAKDTKELSLNLTHFIFREVKNLSYLNDNEMLIVATSAVMLLHEKLLETLKGEL